MKKGFFNNKKEEDSEEYREMKGNLDAKDDGQDGRAGQGKKKVTAAEGAARFEELDDDDNPLPNFNDFETAPKKATPEQFGGANASGFLANARNGNLVINEHWLADPAKRNSVMRAVRKRINRPGNRANADAVRAKWSRLLDARPELYRYWKELVELGKHKELLKLDLHLLEKELLATDQKDVMLAVMGQFVAGAPGCCDEILDGFEVIQGSKTPSIMWRDGDRMISMTLMRLHKLMITRNDDHHLDIVDQWDKDSEDEHILAAWEERARSWNMEDGVLEKAKEWKLRSVEKDRVTATELLLRDFVGYVYVVQANRLITYHKAVMLEEEVLEEERSKEQKKEKKKAKKQQRKDKNKAEQGSDAASEVEEVASKPATRGTESATAKGGAQQPEEEWFSFQRARRQVLAERVVRRQRHLSEMCKPKTKAGAEVEEVEEEPMDEWQTFDEVLAEIKKEIGNYKTS